MPIALTEAFGCNKCQQIFEVKENGQVIEQLSTTYPYKKAWQWTGTRWHRAHSGFKEHYVPMMMAIALGVLFIGLLFAQRFDPGAKIIFLALIVLIIVIGVPLLLWLAYRR